MRIDLAGVNVTAWADRDAGLRPGREGLANPIRTYECTLVEVRTPSDAIPVQPLHGQTFDVYDDTPTLVFSGRVSTVELVPLSGARTWRIGAQSWAVRFFETDTRAIDMTSVVATDREHVVDILTDAFLTDGVDWDPIGKANSPLWPGVQATTVVAQGKDYSYMRTWDALQLLMKDVPGVSIQVRPDLIVEYGTTVTAAPMALCTYPAPSVDFLEVLDRSYSEDEIVGDHRNRFRLRGGGLPEVEAVDLVSVARFGRYLDAPQAFDSNMAVSDVERIAYARLANMRVRRRAQASVINATGFAPGQLVQTYSDLAYPFEDGGYYIDVMSWYGPSRFDVQILQYERPEMIVQEIERELIGPGPNEVNALQLGDAVLDYATAVSRRIGGAV